MANYVDERLKKMIHGGNIYTMGWLEISPFLPQQLFPKSGAESHNERANKEAARKGTFNSTRLRDLTIARVWLLLMQCIDDSRSIWEIVFTGFSSSCLLYILTTAVSSFCCWRRTIRHLTTESVFVCTLALVHSSFSITFDAHPTNVSQDLIHSPNRSELGDNICDTCLDSILFFFQQIIKRFLFQIFHTKKRMR